jgi:hypothetical protein
MTINQNKRDNSPGCLLARVIRKIPLLLVSGTLKWTIEAGYHCIRFTIIVNNNY